MKGRYEEDMEKIWRRYEDMKIRRHEEDMERIMEGEYEKRNTKKNEDIL